MDGRAFADHDVAQRMRPRQNFGYFAAGLRWIAICFRDSGNVTGARWRHSIASTREKRPMPTNVSEGQST
jgi:hypothetical protein